MLPDGRAPRRSLARIEHVHRRARADELHSYSSLCRCRPDARRWSGFGGGTGRAFLGGLCLRNARTPGRASRIHEIAGRTP